MRKILYILLLLFFASCQKQDRIVYTATTQDAFVISVNADTLLADGSCWDLGGRVLRIEDKKIRVVNNGHACIKNFVLDAPETQFVIDTGITLINCKPYNGVFSATWLGVLPANTDNSFHIQKAINTCLDNGIRNLKLPNGNYNFSSPLSISKLVGNAYQQVSLHFFGDASFWDIGSGTTLNYTNTGGTAFNLQLNKGSEVDHLRITGKFKSPTGNDSTYFNLSEANYNDVSGLNCNQWYTGFSIDGYAPPNGSQSGSTGNKVHDMYISNFTKLITMSENGVTANNDIEIFENIHLGDGKYGFVNGQAQEKGNVIRGLYSWGSIYCLINIGKFGKYQAGNYLFDGGNVAGRCIYLLNVNQGSWFSSHLTNFFCESLKSIGTVSTNIPFTIEKSSFNFMFPSQIGQRNVFNNNSAKTQIRDCTLRFYSGLSGEIWVHSPTQTFDNNNNYFYLQTLIYK